MFKVKIKKIGPRSIAILVAVCLVSSGYYASKAHSPVLAKETPQARAPHSAPSTQHPASRIQVQALQGPRIRARSMSKKQKRQDMIWS